MYIELRGCTKTIYGKYVLKDINLQLSSGKIYGIVGERGAGKTMLLSAISHTMCCTEGTVLIDGELQPSGVAFLKRIGMYMDMPALLNSESAFENLKRLSSLKGTFDSEDINDILSDFELEEDSLKYGEYTEEHKMRLRIAQALTGKPELILLDEAYERLSQSGKQLLNKRLLKEKERGAMVLFASENMKESMCLADEIILMEHGRVKCVTKTA